jgi:hypothetical protein
MPRSDGRHELAKVQERKERAHCDANEDRWVEMQAAMHVYCRPQVNIPYSDRAMNMMAFVLCGCFWLTWI